MQISISNSINGEFNDEDLSTMKMGVYDYNDLNTQTTPISLVGGEGYVRVTNDGLGAFTNKDYALTGVPDIYNTASDTFDFTDLSLGDTVDFRLELGVTTTTTNTEFDVILRMAVGGLSYDLEFETEKNYKVARVHRLNRWNGMYIGDANTLNNGAYFMIKSDKGCTILVGGWYARVITRI